MDEQISAAVDAWVVEHIHGSPVAQNTEAWNHLYQSLPTLKAKLCEALAPKPAAPVAAEAAPV